MNSSEDISKVAEALALAQAEFGIIEKDKHNPAFKSAANTKGSPYASLSSQIKATQPALNKHGLCINQSPSVVDGRVIVVTRLSHKSGQWLENSISIRPMKDDAQGIGSAITYGRRYGRSAMLDIDAEESDDDGNEAVNKPASAELNLEEIYKGEDEQKKHLADLMRKLNVTDTEVMKKISSNLMGKKLKDAAKLIFEINKGL